MLLDLLTKKTPPLTGKHREILQKQVIDDNQPGTILRDVATMLKFIGDAGHPVTNANKWLTTKSLGPLNDQMARPIRLINTHRPQQKSYSNIHGLYLVLRCSGLLGIIKNKTRTLLVVDEQMLEAWTALNPTERYFSLLETWLLRSNDEVIGNQVSAFLELSQLHKISRFVHSLPTDGADATNFTNFDNDLRFNIGLHHMALLEMFDLVSIQQNTSKGSKGWAIRKISRTQYGDALLRLLAPLDDALDRNQPANDAPPGIQSVVQPLFPECRHIMTVPVHEFKDGVYIFTVSLGKSWRRIAVPGSLVFESLSDAILQTFGFDHNHLYRFGFRDPLGIEQHIDHPYLEDGSPTTTEMAIGDVPLVPGSIMTYYYDFGDNWEFEIILDTIQPPNLTFKTPKVLEKHGTAPEQYPEW